eukprot:TRINITY_DN16220_c0_g1_i1.p1 TRINITY_DN16220_c0_g1~~TRINITY_DN16220_c0_g1_i1.p1  ORF type:complete len:134 (-),score=26.76 TRINITY_DN16220_c0_g1_i1:159-560(-)
MKKFVERKIEDLKPNMKGITITFIILEKGQTIKKKDSQLYQTIIADISGSITICIWFSNVICDNLNSGDILRLTNGYTNLDGNGFMTLFCGSKSKLERLGQFCYLFNEKPNWNEKIWSDQEFKNKNPKHKSKN